MTEEKQYLLQMTLVCPQEMSIEKVREYIQSQIFTNGWAEAFNTNYIHSEGFTLSHPYVDVLPNSTDLLLIAHDEWKRREERKHQHPEPPWVSGWISGFLTSKKFVQDRVAELRKAGEQG